MKKVIANAGVGSDHVAINIENEQAGSSSRTAFEKLWDNATNSSKWAKSAVASVLFSVASGIYDVSQGYPHLSIGVNIGAVTATGIIKKIEEKSPETLKKHPYLAPLLLLSMMAASVLVVNSIIDSFSGSKDVKEDQTNSGEEGSSSADDGASGSSDSGSGYTLGNCTSKVWSVSLDAPTSRQNMYPEGTPIEEMEQSGTRSYMRAVTDQNRTILMNAIVQHASVEERSGFVPVIAGWNDVDHYTTFAHLDSRDKAIVRVKMCAEVNIEGIGTVFPVSVGMSLVGKSGGIVVAGEPTRFSSNVQDVSAMMYPKDGQWLGQLVGKKGRATNQFYRSGEFYDKATLPMKESWGDVVPLDGAPTHVSMCAYPQDAEVQVTVDGVTVGRASYDATDKYAFFTGVNKEANADVLKEMHDGAEPCNYNDGSPVNEKACVNVPSDTRYIPGDALVVESGFDLKAEECKKIPNN